MFVFIVALHKQQQHNRNHNINTCSGEYFVCNTAASAFIYIARTKATFYLARSLVKTQTHQHMDKAHQYASTSSEHFNIDRSRYEKQKEKP